MAKYGHVLLDENFHEALVKTVKEHNLGSNKAFITNLLLADDRFKKNLK